MLVITFLFMLALDYQDAPALPLPDGVQPKGHMQEMEDFLDELLT